MAEVTQDHLQALKALLNENEHLRARNQLLEKSMEDLFVHAQAMLHIYNIFKKTGRPPELPDIFQQTIDNSFELSVRTSTCFKHANIRTIAELVTKTDGEILSIKNLGRRSYEEIRGILVSYGLKFRMTQEEMLAWRPLDSTHTRFSS